MEADQQFIEMVVKAIVNNPDKVKAARTIDERGVLITLDVDPADMGYVIGRAGQTARSLRTLLKIVGAKHNARVNLKINEPEGGRGPRSMQSSAGATPIDTSAVDNLDI
ncbi:MAG: KH domain-containing protein [Candidatus Magasanikbacteria bacterium]